MAPAGNELVWDGRPGHYEVYYLTLTDPRAGVGCWIRYTLLSPLAGGDAPSAALWFLAMDPRPRATPVFARRSTYPIEALTHAGDELALGPARLDARSATGELPGCAWELRYEPSALRYEHIHPLLRRVADTQLVLPQADLTIDGWVTISGERLELRGARGGQAHLWGGAHARRWAWVHCNDFRDLDGTPQPGSVLDAVSAVVRRAGREVGPNTPVVGRFEGEDFVSRSPIRVLANDSRFALSGWSFTATAGSRRLIAEVDAPRRLIAGVTYHDPDGEPAYCYNTETATLRVQVLHRARRVGGWMHRATLLAEGRAHFEYGQREPVRDVELLL